MEVLMSTALSHVTKKQAEAVLAGLVELWPLTVPADDSAAPHLRDHDKEEQPEGCWSIDWEGGDAPYDWPYLFCQYASGFKPVQVAMDVWEYQEIEAPKWARFVFLEPINGCILGIYPAGAL